MTLESSSLELEKLLAGKRSVAIISHFNPDGDACGSSMGLYSFLHSRGIHAEVVLPSRPPVFLDFLDKDRITRYYTDDRDAARQAVSNCPESSRGTERASTAAIAFTNDSCVP